MRALETCLLLLRHCTSPWGTLGALRVLWNTLENHCSSISWSSLSFNILRPQFIVGFICFGQQAILIGFHAEVPQASTRAYLAKGLRTGWGIQSSNDMVQWIPAHGLNPKTWVQVPSGPPNTLRVSLLKQSPIHEWFKQQKTCCHSMLWRSEVQDPIDSFWGLRERKSSRHLLTSSGLLAICGFGISPTLLSSLCALLHVCMSKFSFVCTVILRN